MFPKELVKKCDLLLRVSGITKREKYCRKMKHILQSATVETQ